VELAEITKKEGMKIKRIRPMYTESGMKQKHKRSNRVRRKV